MLAQFLLTNKKIFVVVTAKTQRRQPYATTATKKKNVATKREHDQRSDSHWWHQAASHRWSRKHQFDTCQSHSQGNWGLLS